MLLDEWEKELGMQVLVAYKLMNINDIKQNKQYQRLQEEARCRKIEKSIKRYGYWPQEVIILNELHEAIDGNHRVLAAKKNNIKEIPVSIVTFSTKEKEAKFFTIKNNFSTSLRPIDFWHARFLSGHPYAELIYKLESDERSLFYRKIAIKNHATKESKFTIPKAMCIINTAALKNPLQWNQSHDILLTKKVEKTNYSYIVAETNKLITFFYKIFGENLNANPLAFRSDSIRAFCQFYFKLKEGNFIDDPKKLYNVANKMKAFVLNSEFIKTDGLGKVFSLISFFNKGRKKNRLTYNVDKLII